MHGGIQRVYHDGHLTFKAKLAVVDASCEFLASTKDNITIKITGRPAVTLPSG